MKLLIGNWKMAPETPKQAGQLAKATTAIARSHKKDIVVIACVPYIYITPVATAARTLLLGAQNISPATTIAATGQISAGMLKATGITYCIVGHSECRATGESNEIVKEKINRLLEKKIQPIVCVGEKSRDSQGWYLSVVKDQIESALHGVPKAVLKRFIIAYEPVWAIGADAEREAIPAECREMIIYIRKLVADLYDEKSARALMIVYGGSVNEMNAQSFISDGEANGLLVGRVSLEPKRFAALAKAMSVINHS